MNWNRLIDLGLAGACFVNLVWAGLWAFAGEAPPRPYGAAALLLLAGAQFLRIGERHL